MSIRASLLTPKPLFILGLPRSGTTLLLSLLDGHPQLLTDVGESRFFLRYLPKSINKSYSEWVGIADRELLHMFQPISVYYQNFLTHIPYQEVFDNFHSALEKSARRPPDFLESYFYAIGLASGFLNERTRFWVEKTPYNEFFLNTILRWWPNAHFIHVVRDPRDIFASYGIRTAQKQEPEPLLDDFICTYRESITRLTKFRHLLKNDRYFVLNYHDLVIDLENTLTEVRHFLDIDDDPLMRTPTKGLGRVNWGGNAASRKKMFAVNVNALGNWQSTLKEDTVRTIEGMLHKQMHYLGFQFSYPKQEFRNPLILRIKVAVRWLVRRRRYLTTALAR